MFHEGDEQHMIPLDKNTDNPRIHMAIHKDFLRLRQAAQKKNLDLSVASGYRDYRRQREIWNGKASGRIPLRNERGDIIPIKNLSKQELVLAILRWSALPGFSRHHWGSDLDVFDAKACPRPQLLPGEYHPGGPCHPLFLFLKESLEKFGFFHPYDLDRGGIHPEPWHISHRKISQPLQKKLSPDGLKNFITLRRDEIHLSDQILKQADLIFERFIANISP